MHPPCPAKHEFECHCKFLGRIVEGVEATYYPASGLVRVRRMLFKVDDDRLMGRHFWEMALSRGGLWIFVDKKHRRYGLDVSRVYGKTPTNRMAVRRRATVNMLDCANGVSLVVQVWRIQRVARAFLERLQTMERNLAAAMAWHARLGEGSRLGRLGNEMVRMIL